MSSIRPAFAETALGRRGFLVGGICLVAALNVPGAAWAARKPRVDALHTLMALSVRNAFAKLTAVDGFWTSAVARIELPVLFNKSNGALGQAAFRETLKHKLNNFAEAGARAAQPLATGAIGRIPANQSRTLLRGEATAGTSYLRQQVGPALVNAMIPALEQAMRTANDPAINQAVALLSGVTLMDVAHALALSADNALWYEIGAAEGDIRANPAATGDAALIRALQRR